MHLFKLWSIKRQEKYFILVKANRNIFEDLIAQASTKFRRPIERVVLEKDGTLIDDEEILILLKDETLVGLSAGEKWCDSSSTINAPDTEVPSPIQQPTAVVSPPRIATITDLAELGLKTIDISFEATNIVKSDVSECSDVGNSDVSYVTEELSVRRYDEFEPGPSSAIHHNIHLESAWVDFQIPWNKIPTHMIRSCEEGKRNKQIMTQIIHIVVYEMRQVKTNIPSKAFKCVALKLAERFPDVFRDLDDDGTVLGDGTHSVTMKLVDRNNYLNRPCKRSWPSTSNETRKYRKSLRNAQIGCSNWEPPDAGPTGDLQHLLKRMKVTDDNFYHFLEQTYAEQRKFFNNFHRPPTIDDIKANWPSVLSTAGIFWHFKKLTSIDLADVIGNIRGQSKKLVKYGLAKGLISEHDLRKDSDYDGLAYFEVISKYFKEDFESIFKTYENIDKSEIPTENLLAAPSIVRFENSREYGYIVFLERCPINDTVYANFVESFVISFALYFITNQQYANEVCFTMEMVQRYYCKIHPDIGSKCQKRVGSRGRFLTFINKLNIFNR